MLILFCIIAAAAGYALTYLMIKTSKLTGLLDIPKDGRRMHKDPVPVGGGFAVYVSFSVCLLLYSLFGELSFREYSLPLAVCGLIIALTGLTDDKYGLSAWQKILGQAICGMAMCLFGITVDKLSFFGHTVTLGWIKYPLTVIWIIAVTNIFNLIDGLDGLCTGITSVCAVGIALVGIIDGIPEVTVCAVIFLFACLGFLPHNAHNAKIFPGDAGALFLGFTCAFLTCISVYESETPTPAFLPIFLFGVPVFDCFYAIIRRIANKQSIFEGDGKHIHHVLAKKHGMGKATLILCLISVYFAVCAIVTILGSRSVIPEIVGTALAGIGFAALSVFFSKNTGKGNADPEAAEKAPEETTGENENESRDAAK